MPVTYGLPAAALLMTDRGNAGLAVEVYACASQYPFAAKSRWYQDVLGGPMEAVMAELPEESATDAQKRGQAQEWHDMATELLADL